MTSRAWSRAFRASPGELLGLQWGHVDLEEETQQVLQTLQRVDGRLQLLPPKTRTSRRIDTGLVFATTIGTPIEPDNLSRGWYQVRKALDAPLPLREAARRSLLA